MNLNTLMIDSLEINSLILDKANLSRISFNGIISAVTSIEEVSLVGTDLADTTTLDNLLEINSLELLTVDPSLYGTWQSDLDTWEAGAGHTLVIVPEPAMLSLLALGGLAILRRKRK